MLGAFLCLVLFPEGTGLPSGMRGHTMTKRSTPSTQGMVIVLISLPWIGWLSGGISIVHLLSTHMINVVESLEENH